MPIKKHIKAQMGSAEIDRLNIAYAKIAQWLSDMLFLPRATI
jgi:hypothetical protein